jgi:hypothetical protein
MIIHRMSQYTLFLISALAALPAGAEDVFYEGVNISDYDVSRPDLWVDDDTVLNGNLCVGWRCLFAESFSAESVMKLKATETSIYFDDQPWISGYPSRDWRLKVNDSALTSAGGIDRFSIEDIDAGTVPFTVAGGAPDNALWVADTGQVGFGTMLPQSMLHAAGLFGPGLRLQQIGSGGMLPAQTWEVKGQTIFSINDITAATIPFQIDRNAPSFAFHIDESGFVGLGTSLPQELLHIRSDAADTDAFALFEAVGTGSDAAFRLKQNGVTPTTWEFRNQQDSGRLNVGLAAGNTPFKIDNAANNNLMLLGRNGRPDEVHVTGKLVVNNTQLNVPDYVFSDDYALRPLAEVQAFIDAHSHLPDVPSEAEIKADGVNMTAMQMALLKKVEELTLYTLEQEAKLARMAELEDRIARLETLQD